MCGTLPSPSSSASDFLPPAQEPRPWKPLALRSPAGSATRRPLWTLSGWVGRRSSSPGWAAASSLATSRRKDTEMYKGESSGCCGPRGPGRNAPRLGHTCPSKRRPGGTVRWGNLPVPPRRACDSLPWPLGHCHSQSAARGSQAFGPAAARAAGGWWPLAAPRRGGSFAGPRPGARRRRRWGRPALGLAKSLKAPAPSLTPGASNHSVSISLTLFIPLKTHLKTLQAGVRAGLYPH